MHYRVTVTTVGAQLLAGVRQAAQDRRIRVKESLPVDFFRVTEVIAFLEGEIQAGSAGIITTLCNDLLLPTLAAANEAGIPVYLIGGPDPDLYQSLQLREPHMGPIHASIRHIGADMAREADSLAARLMSQGVTHLECITIEQSDATWFAQCGRLVNAFESKGLIAHRQLRAGHAFDLADYALDMAARLVGVAVREVAVVVADYTLYRSLRTGLSFTSKADVTVVIYETAPDILADVRTGKNVVAMDFNYYAQGYLALSLAATERHTGQMVTSDIVTKVTVYGPGANDSQVTDAIMLREVCRVAHNPVCGDPGVAPVTPTGCPCFNRSEVAYKVVGLIPTRVFFSHVMWQGMSDAQRDLPGSTFGWDILDEVDFKAVISDYQAVASNDSWRGAISLDTLFADLAPIVEAMRAVPAAGKPLYLSNVHTAGTDAASMEELLAYLGARSFVGVNAVGSGLWCTRVAVQAGLKHLVVSNVLSFYNWMWEFVRGMVLGFLGEEMELPMELPPGLREDRGDEENKTGVWQLLVAPETNRTAQVINGVSVLDYSAGLEQYVSSAVPAPDVVALPVFDDVMTTDTLAMLKRVAASQPLRTPVRLVTQKCFYPEMAALLRQGMIPGEELLLGCVDEQPYLFTYLPALLAALEQHTGERVVGEIRTERFIHAAHPPPNFSRRFACELAGSQEGYAKGKWGQYYPVCDVRQGCVAQGVPGAQVCSGHGACVFPTRPTGNETTRGAAGACVCQRGRKGAFCEHEAGKERWPERHPRRAGILITLACVAGLVVAVAAGVYLLWFRKGGRKGMDVVEEFLRKRSPPRKGDAITAVITDIEGSTGLWEWSPDVMKQALAIHHSVLRSLLPKYYGYESDTEGDSFTLVFHSSFDALGWAMDVQRTLIFPRHLLLFHGVLSPRLRRTHRAEPELTCDWPAELLTFPTSKEERCDIDGTFLYRGLRVRMGIHIGIAEDCTAHVNGRQRYYGEVMEVAKAVADSVASGGQVLMSMLAWQSLGVQPPNVLCQHLGLHEVGDKIAPLHLMQVVPNDLIRRLPFSPLSSKQLSPSFFNAPCADCYIKGTPPSQPVVIAFIYVSGRKLLRRHASYGQAIELLVNFVQRLAPHYNAYECEENEGNFLLVFSSPVMAASMADTVQRKAMELPWPEGLLELEPAAEVIKAANEQVEGEGEGTEVVYRGLRMQIGLCMGIPVDCSPHRATGRAAYYGPIVNRAARIAATAAPGQILCNHVLYESIRDVSPDLMFKKMGNFDLKGVREPMQLYQISDSFLSARLFPRVLKLARQVLPSPKLHAADGGSSMVWLDSNFLGDSLPHVRTSSAVGMEDVDSAAHASHEASPMQVAVRVSHASAPPLGRSSLHPQSTGMTEALDAHVRSGYANASHAELVHAIMCLRTEMAAMRARLPV